MSQQPGGYPQQPPPYWPGAQAWPGGQQPQPQPQQMPNPQVLGPNGQPWPQQPGAMPPQGMPQQPGMAMPGPQLPPVSGSRLRVRISTVTVLAFTGFI